MVILTNQSGKITGEAVGHARKRSRYRTVLTSRGKRNSAVGYLPKHTVKPRVGRSQIVQDTQISVCTSRKLEYIKKGQDVEATDGLRENCVPPR